MTDGNHPYTGIFKGSKHAILRLSDAHLWLDGRDLGDGEEFEQGDMAPSVAIKFLRDEKPSANYLGMVGFENQGQGTNFFALDFSNHLPEFREHRPVEDTCGEQTIGRFHSQMTRFIYSNGSLHMADYDEFG